MGSFATHLIHPYCHRTHQAAPDAAFSCLKGSPCSAHTSPNHPLRLLLHASASQRPTCSGTKRPMNASSAWPTTARWHGRLNGNTKLE